ncbi:hypothetical protein [Cytobacillus praedii]|uniref:Uncharacterized protein n=1 Tax=Cytobacillus praedii TaxID=1742358 RepID=A0A4R1AKG6_9BACI|nr:hypothetical protein [Cytobacillus praedii]TCJ00008.1 hypothetical protein E0Y62_27005 [Cytobacillus praedii]
MEGYSLTLVRSDDGDWEGLYVDGILDIEGHSLSNYDWIDLITRHNYIVSIEQFYINGELLEEIGASFPYKLSEIPNGYLRKSY